MFDSPKSKSASGQPKPDITNEVVEKLLLAAFVMAVFGGGATYKILKSRPEFFTGTPLRYRFIVAASALLLAVILVQAAYFFELRVTYQVLMFILASWCVGFVAVWSTAGVWLKMGAPDRITVSTLRRKTPKSDSLKDLLANPLAAPIGVSLKTGEPVVLPILQRREHMIGAGATGQGKTTLIMTLLKHAFYHKHPVIIIDPKGEVADIRRIKSLAERLGRDPSEFKLFTLASPQTSAKYNPLESGTPEQRKAKLMDGLDLKHEYYGAMAAKYLGTLLDLYDFMKIQPTLQNIQQALLNKKFLTEIHSELRNREDSLDTRGLLDKLASIQKIDAKELAGLSAQIEAFNSREFASLLSPKQDDPTQIRLLDVLKYDQIAYFQMNVNGYGDIARRIGKLIIQDLKATSSFLHAGQTDVKFDFAACFIDEFGSFATADFADFLKQVRSSNIGVHLLCQGMADLRAVSPEFEAQILGNTVTKIIFRTDIPEDAEGWAGQAGTIDDFDESFQVTRNLLWTERTGTGTQNPSKKMKIDFDVFKSLKPGQAVMIDKARGIEDLISIWNAKSDAHSLPEIQIPSPGNARPKTSERHDGRTREPDYHAPTESDWIAERRKLAAQALAKSQVAPTREGSRMQSTQLLTRAHEPLRRPPTGSPKNPI